MRTAWGLVTHVTDRRGLALPLIIPSVAGLFYLWTFDAPARLLAVNAGALVLAAAWVLFARLPAARSARLVVGGVAVLALFAPLVTGPDVGGVTRWLPAGPILLHSGTLLLPLVTVIAAREARLGAVFLAVATTALGLQPDAAALAAGAAASAVLALLHRSIAFAAVAVGTAVLATLTFSSGTLEPQVFTEGVLAQVAGQSALWAAGLAAMLFVAPLWLLATAP